MTLVNCEFYDGNNVAVTGKVKVYLLDSLVGATKTNVAAIATKVLVAGGCQLDLTPTDLSKQVYVVELYQTTNVTSTDPDTGLPVTVAVDTLIDSWKVVVPYSATAIEFESLIPSTGIDRERTSTTIASVVRRMYADPQFWNLLQQELYPYKGNYASSTYYSRGDVVGYDGGTWLCVSDVPVTGVTPTNGAIWVVWAMRGSNGTGTNGNDTAYDSTGWDSQTDAPSRNSVRDALEGYKTSVIGTYAPLVNAALVTPTRAIAPPVGDSTTAIPNTSWVQTELSFVKVANVPVGGLVMYLAGARPLGYIKVGTGATLDVSQTTYSLLYAKYGATFGSSTAGNFRLPDNTQLPTLPSVLLSWYVFTGRND